MTAHIAGLQRTPDSTLLTLHGPGMQRLVLRVVEHPAASLSLGDTIACEGETFEGVASVLWTRRINPRGEEPIVDAPLTVVSA